MGEPLFSPTMRFGLVLFGSVQLEYQSFGIYPLRSYTGQAFPPSFLQWKNMYILRHIWNNFFFNFSKGPPFDLAHFPNLADIVKKEPNQISKSSTYTFFHHRNDTEKCLAPKMKPQFISCIPYQTPCTQKIIKSRHNKF